MSQLLDELRKDPSATFEMEADLPSGNQMMATVGPIINGRLAAHAWFSQDPPSEADIALAREILNSQLGEPEIARVTNTVEGHRKSAEIMRGFMGGGQG